MNLLQIIIEIKTSDRWFLMCPHFLVTLLMLNLWSRSSAFLCVSVGLPLRVDHWNIDQTAKLINHFIVTSLYQQLPLITHSATLTHCISSKINKKYFFKINSKFLLLARSSTVANRSRSSVCEPLGQTDSTTFVYLSNHSWLIWITLQSEKINEL